MRIRVHNERAFHANINDKKMDYIDAEMEALKRDIERQHRAQEAVEREIHKNRTVKNGVT